LNRHRRKGQILTRILQVRNLSPGPVILPHCYERFFIALTSTQAAVLL